MTKARIIFLFISIAVSEFNTLLNIATPETNFPLSDVASLKVVNSLGAPVYETQNLASNEIQLLNAGSGLYFVVIILKNGTVLTQKMMVQR